MISILNHLFAPAVLASVGLAVAGGMVIAQKAIDGVRLLYQYTLYKKLLS